MLAPALPYLPTPRPAAPDLGRRPAGTPLDRGLALVQQLTGILLFIAAPAAFAWAAIYCLLNDEWSVYLRAFGFIVLMPIALVYLKSFLPRHLPARPAVIPVKPETEPTLHAFLYRVAGDVGAPTPRRIWIGSGMELGIRSRRSIVDLFRVGRYDIEIGLWLWHGLTLSEFQAILTRTLAPFSRGRLERLRLSARAVLHGLVVGRDFIDEMSESHLPFAGFARLLRRLHSIAVSPMRLFGRIVLRTGTVDEDALVDDLVAVRITGSDALVHAVLRADFAAAGLEHLDRNLERASREGVFTRDLYAHSHESTTAVRELHNDFMLGETPTLRGPNAGKYADVFEPGQHYLSTMWSGMPSPLDREQNAKKTFVACERDDRSASDLIDNPSLLRERLTVLHYEEKLGCEHGFLAMTPEVVARWLRKPESPNFPARCADVYDSPRPIDPGTPPERETALRSDPWTDARLVRTTEALYTRAGERAAEWRSARAALDKVQRRTIYRPMGRDRAIVEDLEDDLRKASRWLSALDRWAYIVHVHMAARLPNLALHDELIKRYESVLRFAPLAADIREYRNRVAAFVRRLEDYDGLAPYRLQRDSGREFRASRKDLGVLLSEAPAIDDPFIGEWIGGMPLDEFLYSHTKRSLRRRLPVSQLGLRLLNDWEEVLRKSRWLNELGMAALVELQERIAQQFAAQVGPLPPEEPDLEVVVVEPPAEEVVEFEPEPDVIEAELDEGSEMEATDQWGD